MFNHHVGVNMKTKYIALPFFLITLFSCSDNRIIDPSTPDTSANLSFNKTSFKIFNGDTIDSNVIIDSSGVIPPVPIPGVLEVKKWGIDHYRAKHGKIVGIWARNSRLQNTRTISRLRTKFGFNYIFFAGDHATFNLIRNSGYSNKNIMIGVSPNDYSARIQQFGAAYAYYNDEPYERGYSIDVMTGMRNAINNYAPGSKLIISGYRRTSGLGDYVSRSDGILFSSYTHWYQIFLGVWVSWPVDRDQRPDWRDMKDRYGDKSFMNWIGAHKDLSEYSDLLSTSRSLSLPGVWLYQLDESEDSDDNILSFCNAAFHNGYMSIIAKKYIYEYHAKKINHNALDSTNPNDEGWYLYKIRIMKDIKEVLPEDSFDIIE